MKLKIPISLIILMILFSIVSGFFSVIAVSFVSRFAERLADGERGDLFFDSLLLLLFIMVPMAAVIGIARRKFWAKVLSVFILGCLIVGQFIAAYDAIFIDKESMLVILQIVFMIVYPLFILLGFCLLGKKERSYFNRNRERMSGTGKKR